MRNLLILAAAFGLAGVANAQSNTANVDQTGNSNEATATQSQSSGSTADIDQSGDDNEATAIQIGGANSATINQSGADGGNTVSSTQTGTNTLIATQSIGGNGLTSSQTGAGNFAEVEQRTSTTRGGAPTGGHEADITQNGAGNEISLRQSFGSNSQGPAGAHEATLNQQGDGNLIGGEVDDDLVPSVQDSRSERIAFVDQVGDNNEARFTNGANLDIDQIGDGNFATSSGGGTIVINQDGDDNDAINQGNNATILQTGDLNYARSKADQNSHTTSQTQTGSSNSSDFFGFRSQNNLSTSVQIGDWNKNSVNWNENGANTTTIDQSSAVGITEAEGNFASVEFDDPQGSSTGNTVDVDQTGLSNSATVFMNTGGNTADVMQSGNSNTAIVNQ